MQLTETLYCKEVEKNPSSEYMLLDIQMETLSVNILSILSRMTKNYSITQLE